MNALTQSLFTNIPLFVALAGLTILAIIGYKNLRSEMRDGFLSHDRDIKEIKNELKSHSKKFNRFSKKLRRLSKKLTRLNEDFRKMKEDVWSIKSKMAN